MKIPFVSFRKSLLVLFTAASICLPIVTKADIVVNQTYTRSSSQSFSFDYFASHYDYIDNQPSKLTMTLSLVIRDASGAVISGGTFVAESSQGEIDILMESEDDFLWFDPVLTEGGSGNGLAEHSCHAEFNPPGSLQGNYTVELMLIKDPDIDEEKDSVNVSYWVY